MVSLLSFDYQMPNIHVQRRAIDGASAGNGWLEGALLLLIVSAVILFRYYHRELAIDVVSAHFL